MSGSIRELKGKLSSNPEDQFSLNKEDVFEVN